MQHTTQGAFSGDSVSARSDRCAEQKHTALTLLLPPDLVTHSPDSEGGRP